jgi:hypothetical protein
MLIDKTGGIEDKDLVVSADKLSVVFTAHKTGTTRVRATLAGLNSVDSGVITVIASAPPPPPTLPPNNGSAGDEGNAGGGVGTGERQYLTRYINPRQAGVFATEANLKTWDGLLRLNIPKGVSGKTVEGWGLSYVIIEPIRKEDQKLPHQIGVHPWAYVGLNPMGQI